MWTSKLGNKYPLDVIQANDVSTQKELKRLRGLKEQGNHVCADCGAQDSSWASVTHGVFVCVVCSDVHRSVGTHITKMKGCTGTYLWGPDELEKMQTVGNRKADEVFGDRKVSPLASKEEKQRFVEAKYAKLVSAGHACAKSTPCEKTKPQNCAPVKAPLQQIVRPVHVAAATTARQMPSDSRSNRPMASKSSIPDSFFEDLFGEIESTKTRYQEQPRHSSNHDTSAPRTGSFDDFWDDAFDSFESPSKHTSAAFPPLDLLA